MKPKILILILSSHKYPSPRNEKAQHCTWVKTANKHGIEVINFLGGYQNSVYDKPYLKLTSNDSIEHVGYKTIEAFEWCVNNLDFEYIFRVNSSSFVNIKKLINFINTLEQEYIYCGKTINLKMLNINFISGSGIILNKNSVIKIIENKEIWDHSFIDDVALGVLMNKLKIYPTEGFLYELKNNVYEQNEKINSYHIRCKLEDFGYPRFLESFNLFNLNKIELNSKLNKTSIYLSLLIFKIFKLFNLKFYLMKYFFRNRHLRNRLRKHKNKLFRLLNI